MNTTLLKKITNKRRKTLNVLWTLYFGSENVKNAMKKCAQSVCTMRWPAIK